MKYGIALTPVIPMRDSASESAEMTNQLLFGDTFRILEEEPRWYRVESLLDGYTGWVDWKMVTPIEEAEVTAIQSQPLYFAGQPITDIHRKGEKRPMRISIGSRFPNYDKASATFTVAGQTFGLPARMVSDVKPAHIRVLLRTAELFLNTPYLWGGRNIFGIDCSGFVQMVYRMHGIDLPRDASQQVNCGEPVASFEEAYPGDLAFFANANGRITHVGIVLTPDTIIHSSGDVHVDKLTAEGIWSDKQNCYTHSAPILRRHPQLSRRG